MAYRIASKVIESGGDNKFLKGGKYHANVRKDYVDTDTRIVPKTAQKERVCPATKPMASKVVKNESNRI